MIEITGQVADATTGLGIPMATISVNGKAVGAADSGGNFTLSVADYSDTITASSVGYVTLTQQASSVLESGVMQLAISPDALPTATVTAKKPNNATWLALAGIGIIALASSKDKGRSVGKVKGKDLVIPVAALGLGAWLILKPKTAVSPGTAIPTAPYAPTRAPAASSNPLSAIGPLAGLASSVSKLFGGSEPAPGAASFTPVQVAPVTNTNPASFDPAAQFPTLSDTAPGITLSPGAQAGSDQAAADEEFANQFGYSFAGVGDASSGNFNAGDIIGKNLTADMTVPIYNQANDSAKPVTSISKGNSVGIVYSYLNANPAEGRNELWWMFEAGPDQQSWADSGGYYYVPHHGGYFNVQDLVDQGVLTVAQATALQQDSSKSVLQQEIEKYVPWIIGGLVAVGIGKAIINKAF